MQKQKSGIGCQRRCWSLAAGVALLVFILLLAIGGWGFIGALFMAGLAFVVLGFAFNWILCRDLPADQGSTNIHTPGASATSAPAPKAAPPAQTADESTGPAKAAPVASPAPAAAASEAQPEAKTATAKTAAEAGARVKPSTPLAGQEELASRKGSWKYEAEAKPAAKPAAKAKPATQATPDYDGDGKLEGSGEGAKPETLSEAREGGPDNLKEIKGVGPKLEKLLNSMGFYHFDQIANWTADEEAWVNANLAGFKGRVSRDNWVEQAKILASGGETEFSKRVDEGGVY